MNAEQKVKIRTFLQDQIENAHFRVKAYVFDESGNRRFGRNVGVKLSMHINNFVEKKSSVRWLIMCGLRGAGKTTLLAQLYEQTKTKKTHKLFLSVDQVIGVFGVSLKDVLSVYEEMLGAPFEKIKEPIFLFLDEVQYDEKWALLLKTIYDRSSNIFIVVTGSSALSLQTNPDVARRSVFEKLYPMSFTEYIKIKHQKVEVRGLSKTLRDSIFNSADAREVFTQLKACEQNTRSYWNRISEKEREIEQYMQYGTLPFVIAMNNEALVYDQIKKTLERVISVDIPHIEQFDQETILKIPMLLYALAETNQLSLVSLSNKLDMSRPVVSRVLETLERTETVWRVYPHGSHAFQVRQPSKYLFTTPAFRSMYFNFIGNTRTENNYRGNLLEDTVGLYINRLFSDRPNTSVTYDSAEGGADFIIRVARKSIVMEVGTGGKGIGQVERTMHKTGLNPSYGIVVSQSPLSLAEDQNVVTIPLSYFLLT